MNRLAIVRAFWDNKKSLNKGGRNSESKNKNNGFYGTGLDVYARLTENQLLNRAHPEEGMFIAESPKVIERALDAGCIPVSLLMETKHVQGEAKEMIERCGDIPYGLP